jgi:hypothetical protein
MINWGAAMRENVEKIKTEHYEEAHQMRPGADISANEISLGDFRIPRMNYSYDEISGLLMQRSDE